MYECYLGESNISVYTFVGAKNFSKKRVCGFWIFNPNLVNGFLYIIWGDINIYARWCKIVRMMCVNPLLFFILYPIDGPRLYVGIMYNIIYAYVRPITIPPYNGISALYKLRTT